MSPHPSLPATVSSSVFTSFTENLEVAPFAPETRSIAFATIQSPTGFAPFLSYPTLTTTHLHSLNPTHLPPLRIQPRASFMPLSLHQHQHPPLNHPPACKYSTYMETYSQRLNSSSRLVSEILPHRFSFGLALIPSHAFKQIRHRYQLNFTRAHTSTPQPSLPHPPPSMNTPHPPSALIV